MIKIRQVSKQKDKLFCKKPVVIKEEWLYGDNFTPTLFKREKLI